MILDKLAAAKEILPSDLQDTIFVFAVDEELLLQDAEHEAHGDPEQILAVLNGGGSASEIWERCEQAGLSTVVGE
jgi:hypothetical protein